MSTVSFQKILSGTLSECQIVLIQIRTHVLSQVCPDLCANCVQRLNIPDINVFVRFEANLSKTTEVGDGKNQSCHIQTHRRQMVYREYLIFWNEYAIYFIE